MPGPNDKEFFDAEGFLFPKEEKEEVSIDSTLVPGGNIIGGLLPNMDTSVSPPVRIPGNFKEHPFSRQDTEDVATFDFVACDPVEVGLLPIEECEVCTKDPLAFVPDWKKMPDGEVFFDGQECLYSTVVIASEETPGEDQENVKKYISEGIRNILELNNKKEEIELEVTLPNTENKLEKAARIVSTVLFGPLGLVAADAITSLTNKEGVTTIGSDIFEVDNQQLLVAHTNMVVAIETAGLAETEYHVSIRPNLPMKVLVSVPVKYIQQIPNKVVTQPEFLVPPDELLSVQIMSEDLPLYIQTLTNRLNGAMVVYDRQRLNWKRLGGGYFRQLKYDPEQGSYVPGGEWWLDLLDYAKRIRDFFEDLDKMLKGAGLGVPLPGKIVLGRENFVEKVIINFENIDEVVGGRIRIKNIKVNKKGCPTVWFSATKNEKYFDDFEKLHRDSTVLAYVGQITEMYNMAAAREPSDWIEFVTTFTYPGVEAVLGINAFDTADNITGLSCAVGEGLLDPIESAIGETGAILSELVERKFEDLLCHTSEELEELKFQEWNKIEKRFKAGAEAEVKRYFGTDPLLRELPELIASIAKKGSSSKVELWNDIISNLGKCGIIALLTRASDCLMKGMDFETAKEAMVKSAFKAMDDVNLERVFVGLPPDKQEEILGNIEQKIGSLPAPWENGYTSSSYSSEEWSSIKDLKDVKQAEKEFKELQEESSIFTPENEEEWTAEFKEQKKEIKEKIRQDLFGDTPNSPARIPGVYKGTYGTALGETQKQVFDAYREAILELADVDYLFDALNNLPGAQIIATLIKRSPCKKPSPWSTTPPLDDLFHLYGDFKFCDAANSDGIAFAFVPPRLRVKPNNWIPIKAVTKLLEQIAVELVFQVTMLILRNILKSLVNAVCMAISNLGASLADLVTGNDHFRDLLRQDICGSDATNEQINEALADLLTVFAGPEASCLETLNQEEIGSFIDQVTMTLTQHEIMTLLLGTASDDTIQMVTTVASLSDSECIAELFSNPDKVRDLFASLGGLTDLNSLSDTLAGLEEDIYVNPNVCASKEDLDSLNDVRCFLLTNKGMSEEECAEELKKLEDQAVKDLSDLADLMQGNGPIAPPVNSTSPGCAEDGVFPYTDPNEEACFNVLSDTVFEAISVSHVRDLFGARGVMNMILSDTNGKGLRAHNFFVRLFGASLAYNLGPISFGYTDNAINVKKQVAPINQAGIELTGRDRNGLNVVNLIGAALGQVTKALKTVLWPVVKVIGAAVSVIKGIFKVFKPKKAKLINEADTKKDPFEILEFNISNGGFPPRVASWLKDKLSGTRAFVNFDTSGIDVELSPLFQTKKGEPDLTFKYVDYKGEYSFDIEYDYNLVIPEPITNEQGVVVGAEDTDILRGDYKYKVVITEWFKELEENADEGIGKSILKGATIATAGQVGGVVAGATAAAALLSPEEQPPEPTVLEASSIEEPALLEFVKSLDVDPRNKKSHQVATFNKMVENALRAAGAKDTANIQKRGAIFQNKVFDLLNQKYFSLISKKVAENARAFDFGYDENELPTVDLLDPDKYGGTADNPPFYINAPVRGGWLGLVDALIPEWDACEPRNIALGDFKGLTEMVNERFQQIKEDERLQSDVWCTVEAPYDKILPRASAASMEGITAAIIRIYAIEMILQALPVFSLFEINIPENFDSLLLSYISNEIEEGLRDDGRFPHKNHLEDEFELDLDSPYFYEFMEQVVQSFIRKLPEELNPAGEGTITEEELTVSEIDAYESIQAEIQTFYKFDRYTYDEDNKGLAALNPAAIEAQSILKRIINTRDASVGMGYSDFSKKKAKEAKRVALAAVVEETLKDAKVLLGREIQEEFSRLAEDINGKVKPQIQSIDSLMLGSPQFVDGSLTNGEGVITEPLPVDSDLSSYPVTEYIALKGSFVLQKYIRIADKEEKVAIVNDALRTNNLKNVVNIEDWDDYVKLLRENGVSGKISDFWGDAVETVDIDATSETFGQDIIVGESGWSFGMRLCYVPQEEEELDIIREIVDEIPDEYALQNKAFKLFGERYYIPLASAEIEIPDQEFTNFDPNTYDVACLYKELVATQEYKTLFRYCIPLRTFLSLITIYCIKGFLPSIGSEQDLWTVAGGRSLSGFRVWDQGKLFKKSKKTAKKMFEAAYDALDQDPDKRKGRNQRSRDVELRDVLRPKWNYDIGLRWWQMRKRRSRPYDKYGNEC